MINIKDKTYYNIKECAELLNISVACVRKYLNNGKLVGIKFAGRVYIETEDINYMLSNCKVIDNRQEKYTKVDR